MKNELHFALKQVIEAAKALSTDEGIAFIEKAVALITSTYQKKGKLLLAGNGGSLCDAMHFAEEMTGQYRKRRRALPALALSDPGHMSCVANDMGFDQVFVRGVEAFGNSGDLFIALTTSGASENLYKALLLAKMKGLKTIAFLGKGGGKMKGVAHLEWLVEEFTTSDRIQEAHMAAIHVMIELVERNLFPELYEAMIDSK